jgi:hypothetical protein
MTRKRARVENDFIDVVGFTVTRLKAFAAERDASIWKLFFSHEKRISSRSFSHWNAFDRNATDLTMELPQGSMTAIGQDPLT